MGDVQSVMKDPDFLGLPATEKVKVLSHMDADFAGLPAGEQMKVIGIGASKPQQNFAAMSPQDLAAQAMQASGVTGTQRLAPTAPRVNMQQSPNMAIPSAAIGTYNTLLSPSGDVGRFHGAIEQGLQGIASGVGDMIVNGGATPEGMAHHMIKAIAMSKHPLASAIGVNGEAIEKSANPSGTNTMVGTQPPLDRSFPQPDYASLAGHSALPLALAMAAGNKANAVKEEMLAKPPATAGDVAGIVTDTVNPPPKSMAGFQKSVEAQIPEVVQGKKITNRAELGQAFAESANKARQSYYETYINPIKDASAYGGKTIGQLDARLAEINATLKPTYEKGGAAAQAALSAESKAALTSEAAAIRSNMNKAIAEKLNVPVEQVATARQKFGQMYDVADKIQLALSKERFSANQAAKQQPNLEVTAAGLANKGIQAGYRKFMGHPADRALRNALENYSPSAPPTGVEPSLSPASTRPTPPATRTIEITPQGSTAAEIQAMAERIAANRLARAKQPTLPLTRAKPRWMQE